MEINESILVILYIMTYAIDGNLEDLDKLIKRRITAIHTYYITYPMFKLNNVYSVYLKYGGTLYSSDFIDTHDKLLTQFKENKIEYSSINVLSKKLLQMLSTILVYIREKQYKDKKIKLDDYPELYDWIKKIMEYLIEIFILSEMITKINEEMAATKIQRHTRTRIKSMRNASRAATMSRAATRVQAQQRGKSTRNKYDTEYKIVANEIKLLTKAEQERTKAEQQAKKELDEAEKELENRLKAM
jgi:hypothetical protein